MPELPEVETVRRVLVDWMEGKTIKMVRIIYPSIVDYEDKDKFIYLLTGKTINNINRMGKYLIFDIDGLRLVSHLRMEGKYYRVNSVEEYNNSLYFRKHTHVLFYLSDGTIILYHDVRKFGRFNLFENEQEMLNSHLIGKLGLEPFDVKDGSYLYEKLKDISSTLTLKEMLLDQTIMLGIGNIYADEICFDCKKYPFTKAKDLTLEDCNKVVESSKKILAKAIELGGSSVHTFSFANGVDGKFQEELKVYNKEGEKCPICGNPITKMRLGGRGTCFCASCQKPIIKNNRIVGVTGLIASGKSNVSRMFNELGYELLDADKLAHDCYKKESTCYDKIIKLFGSSIIKSTGEIDTNLVRDIVKNDKNKLKELENIIHPEVCNIIKKDIKDKSKKFILDVPLLFESKLDQVCDITVFVTTLEKTRIERLIARNTMSLSDAKSFNNDLEDAYRRIKKSDFVVDNSYSKEKTKEQVIKIVENA